MKHNPPYRILLLAILAAALALGATACGGSSGGGSSSAGSGGGDGSGAPIDATLKDFSITLSKAHVAPGTYTFHVFNNGPSSHNLTVDGPGVSAQGTPTFPAGGTETLTVTLRAGSYDIYCSVPGHKQAGMDAKLTVA